MAWRQQDIYIVLTPKVGIKLKGMRQSDRFLRESFRVCGVWVN